MDVADRPKDRPRDEVADRRARAAADQIAARHRGKPARTARFVEDQRKSEEVPGPVSAAVRAAIASCGLSLTELGRRSGVSQSQLSRFMAGDRSLTLTAVDKLAPVLKLKLSKRK